MSINPKQIPGLIEGLETLIRMQKRTTNMSKWFASSGSLDSTPLKTLVSSPEQLAVFEKFNFTDMDQAFMGWTIKLLPTINTILGENVSGMVQNCANLTKLQSIHAPYAKNASLLASGCVSLTDVVDMDLSSATNITSMFESCAKLAKIDIKLGQPTLASKAFKGAAALTDISPIDLSKATNIVSIFEGCKSLPQEFTFAIDISSITDIANLSNAFNGSSVKTVRIKCPTTNAIRTVLTTKDLSADDSVKKIILIDENNVESIVDLASRLKALDLSNWITTKKSMIDATSYATAKTADALTVLSTYAISNLENAFYGGAGVDGGLVSLPDPIYTSKSTSFAHAFAGNTKLVTLPAMDASSALAMNSVAEGCTGLTQVEFDTPKMSTTFEKAFSGCSALMKVTGLSTDAATSLLEMFKNAAALAQVDGLKCENVTTMASAFEGAAALKTVNNMTFAKLEDISRAFAGCISLVNAPTLNLAGQSVTFDAHEMFRDCASLTNVSAMDLSKASDVSYMFSGCTSLPATIAWPISVENIADFRKCQFMFEGSSVKNITVKVADAANIPGFVAPVIFGSGIESITVVGPNGSIIETRQKTFAPVAAKEESFTANGQFIVPPGITQLKIAAVSGYTSSFGSYSSNAVCNVSTVGGDRFASKSVAAGEAAGNSTVFSIAQCNDATYGYQLKFDPVLGEKTIGGYSCGNSTSYSNSNGSKAYYATAPGATLNQGYIDVTPGEVLKVVVGTGSAANRINTFNPTGKCSGYVLFGMSWDDTYKKPVA